MLRRGRGQGPAIPTTMGTGRERAGVPLRLPQWGRILDQRLCRAQELGFPGKCYKKSSPVREHLECLPGGNASHRGLGCILTR